MAESETKTTITIPVALARIIAGAFLPANPTATRCIMSISAPPALLIGCDYDRADAIEAFRKADRIEIAGPQAQAIRHPIAVWNDEGVSFFAADMDKVAAFEAARMPPTQD